MFQRLTCTKQQERWCFVHRLQCMRECRQHVKWPFELLDCGLRKLSVLSDTVFLMGSIWKSFGRRLACWDVRGSSLACSVLLWLPDIPTDIGLSYRTNSHKCHRLLIWFQTCITTFFCIYYSSLLKPYDAL